ncbi:hypothetical protein MUN89_00280 [Halobacillus salinarum]|uniref:Uncharacterized protein n=1 Tax=Halobacillus salinarum TaxID=2932257 RepID=A0ABY4EJ13_9BACI|nr:hypothetical protein [Halobacillus salinarum]UOQ44470.1 hypothetical protein MUN89_00280 [Halobacillus salinarum]
MYFIIIAGFIIPWCFGIFLYRKAPILFLTSSLFIALLSLILNQLGIQLGYWAVRPKTEIDLLDSLFLDLGYFAIAGAYFTYFIQYKNYKRIWVYLGTIFILNGLEFLALSTNRVQYCKGWNIGLTFLLYLGGIILLDLYSLKMKKFGIFQFNK